jgi:hypothetical protein
MSSDQKFKREVDTNKLSMSMTQIFMQRAPKKKICTSTMYEHIRTACFITMANHLMSNIEQIKDAIEKGYTLEEVMGIFHVELKDTWDILVKSKLGNSCFRPMDIETIIKASGPKEIISKSVIRN